MASCEPRGWDGHGTLPGLSSVEFFFYLFIPFISFLSVPVVGGELEWFWLVVFVPVHQSTVCFFLPIRGFREFLPLPLQIIPLGLGHFQLLCGLSLLRVHRFAFLDG
jgi:hypothetical protein